MAKKFEPTPELTDLLVRSGSARREEALAATNEFAKLLSFHFVRVFSVETFLATSLKLFN